MYHAVIFDLDGTLLDTLRDLAEACNSTLRQLGFSTHPINAYQYMVGNGAAMLIRRCLPEGVEEHIYERAMALFSDYYTSHVDDFTIPYPGVLDMLNALAGQGMPMAVLSNKPDLYTKKLVQQFFPDIFVSVLGQREDIPHKPDPAAVYELLSLLGTGPAQTLYVGDSDVDMHTAANAGLDSCGVLWGFRDEAELRAAGATYCAGTTESLTHVILGK